MCTGSFRQIMMLMGCALTLPSLSACGGEATGSGAQDSVQGALENESACVGCDVSEDGTPCGTNRYCLAGTCIENTCGDGVLAGTEQCDDGNDVGADGCASNCERETPRCGDATVDQGEECDDGNAIDTDACANNCTHRLCGNGVADGSEECDDGNADDTDSCSNACAKNECGNMRLDPGEVCDGDTADATCINNCSELAPIGACQKCQATYCSNFAGAVDLVAGCTKNSDETFRAECSAVIECAQKTHCGYGELGGPECFCGDADLNTCQQAGAANGPCQQEWYAATRTTSLATVFGSFSDISLPAGMAYYLLECQRDYCETECANFVCGDGVVDQGEECDDGNQLNGDACSTECTKNECGNMRLDPGEVCDGDTADATCINNCRELAPIGACQKCQATNCSNFAGAVDLVAGCTMNSDETFRAECSAVIACAQKNHCGYGELGGPECFCGNADLNSCQQVGAANGPCQQEWYAATRTTSLATVFGSFTDISLPAGMAYYLLECQRDYCEAECANFVCGDGVVDRGEECDDGNQLNDDACSNQCTKNACGNGRVDPGEACDGDTADYRCASDCSQVITSDPCETCQAQNCTNFEGVLDVVAGCTENSDPAFRADCRAVVECAQKNQCGYGEAGAPECFCGTADLNSCQQAGAANGPCQAEWYAAARTTSLGTLMGSFSDISMPAGMAYYLLQCQRDYCHAECVR